MRSLEPVVAAATSVSLAELHKLSRRLKSPRQSVRSKAEKSNSNLVSRDKNLRAEREREVIYNNGNKTMICFWGEHL